MSDKTELSNQTDLQKEAEQLKNQANDHFKKKEYDKAIDFYTKAVELVPKNAVYYANRSLAHLRLENFGFALQDATFENSGNPPEAYFAKTTVEDEQLTSRLEWDGPEVVEEVTASAVQSDPAYIKGYYRRAAAQMSLGKFKKALSDFEYVAKRRPNDEDAKIKFTECNKMVKKQAFERAIAVDVPDKTLAEIHTEFETIAIEDDYKGPQLENGKVTLKFMEELMEFYKQEKRLHKKFAYKILCEIDLYLRKQPSLVDISIPDDAKFTICGDIHGQFYDLMNIFKINGLPSQTNPYLFNGDFVDRGSFSVECIFTLFGFKLLYPDHFFLARGNHESINMNQIYGFTGEVLAKYTSTMSNMFTQVYNWLPLCHCLNSRVLVMHGGLFSQDNVTLNDLRNIERNRQPPEDGLMCELLWSDPQPQNGLGPSKRGVGTQFGPDVTSRFCKVNKLDYVVRSHEVKDMGYEVAHDGKCITVFSAPNYCDTMGNKGAFITLKGKDMKPEYTTYEAVPHPNVKPMEYASSLMNMIM